MDARVLEPPFDGRQIDSVRLQEALAYWLGKRSDGRLLPARADIDPLQLRALLPYLFLVDVTTDPLRFRYRLIGTQIVRWSGGDGTGRYADDEFCGDGRFALLALYRMAAETGRPVLTPWQPAVLDRSMMMFTRLLLPLAADGVRVDMLMGVADERPR